MVGVLPRKVRQCPLRGGTAGEKERETHTQRDRNSSVRAPEAVLLATRMSLRSIPKLRSFSLIGQLVLLAMHCSSHCSVRYSILSPWVVSGKSPDGGGVAKSFVPSATTPHQTALYIRPLHIIIPCERPTVLHRYLRGREDAENEQRRRMPWRQGALKQRT